MADEDQFSLCWNNFNANLSAGFHESLCKGDLVDVTLAAEGQLVKAHRLVLSVCSPYFRKMFTTMPANQHAFVVLKDVSHTALKDLITFMYCGEVNVKHDALPTFISTAEALQIKGLTDSTEPPQSPTKVALSSLPVGTVVTHPSKRPHRSSATAKVTSPTVVAVAAPESEDSADEKFVVPPKRTATKQVIGAPTSKRLKTVVHQTISEPQTTTKVQMINPKTEEVVLHVPITKPEPEPEYAEEETTTIEIAEADPQEEEEEATYVEDEQYTDLKYDETYFTENDETKPGITTYATTTEQSQSEAQGTDPQVAKRERKDPLKTSFWRNDSILDSFEMDNMMFETSGRGNRLLNYQGHRYIKNNVHNQNIYWKCTKWHSGCKARVITSVSEMASTCVLRNVHNHD